MGGINMLKINSIAKNQTEIITDSMTIFFSYREPVACHIDGQGFFKTSKSWSKTTTAHVNKWLKNNRAENVTEKGQSFFDKLIA